MRFDMLQPVKGLIGPKDITAELWREYKLADGNVYRIDNPVALYYRDLGTTHRVVDELGVVHCVPFDRGTVLRWKNKQGLAPVQF